MSLITLRNKVRVILGDNTKTGYDLFTYSTSNIFNISENNINSVDSIYKNDVEQGDSYWIYDSTNNRVTILFSTIVGDTIQINYTYFPNYSTTELTNYIQSALVYLSINNYYNYTYDTTDDTIYPEIEVREENLIARIAALLINPDNKSIKLPDVTINVPNDFPVDKKINMLIATFKKDNHGIFSIV